MFSYSIFLFNRPDTFLQKIGLIITKLVIHCQKSRFKAGRTAHIIELRYFLAEEFSEEKKASTREALNLQLSRIF